MLIVFFWLPAAGEAITAVIAPAIAIKTPANASPFLILILLCSWIPTGGRDTTARQRSYDRSALSVDWVPQGGRHIETLDWDRVYPLAGPIAVEDAAPSDTLAVEILELRVKDWGWTAIIPGLGLLPDEFS